MTKRRVTFGTAGGSPEKLMDQRAAAGALYYYICIGTYICKRIFKNNAPALRSSERRKNREKVERNGREVGEVE